MTQVQNIDGKIFLALKSRLDDWTECDVFYSPDVPQSPPINAPYLIVTDMRMDAATRFSGVSDIDEYRGVFNIAVMTPIGWTYEQGAGLASRICDWFGKGDVYAYDDCNVVIMARTKIVGAPYQDAGRMRYPVNVKWRSSG